MVAAAEVQIRLPTWARVYTVIFGIFWCGSLLLFGIVGRSQPLLLVAPALMFCVGATIVFRQLRLGIASSDNTLIVRNYFRTMIIHKDEIDGFRTGQGLVPIGTSIVIVPKLIDLVNIDATLQGPIFWKDRHPEQLAELHAWLAA